MPVVNPLARELVFKVVYYGPGLGGKTTSLQHVHSATAAEHRGKMVSLATPVDRTLYFDYLPIRIPNVRGMSVRLQLFTVPGQVHYNATRKLVLTGTDGVVFVADSQLLRLDSSLESLRNLEENLLEHGRGLDEMPHVLAYNKRDLADIAPIEELERLLNPLGAPSFATVATSGEGVFESLEAITRAVLEDFNERHPEPRQASFGELVLPEGGLAEALRGARSEPPAVAPRELIAARLERRTDPGMGTAEPVILRAPALAPPPVIADPMGTRLSFEALFEPEDRPFVEQIEVALAASDPQSAVVYCERLVRSILQRGPGAELGRSPEHLLVLLGLDGRRLLEIELTARRLRTSRGSATEVDALRAYSFVLELRGALLRLNV